MSATAFAYILLMRGAEAKDELMALLSQDRRAEVHSVLENVKELPAEQICKQLRELRDSQLKRQRERAKDRIGPQIDHVSPKLYAWLTRIF